ncbi:MAG: aminotransferase class I/II-fold pyridoxal phosphate-dependent enzyme [Alphaproteobacteria bacterium]|nr:aminotransferase class I/II-fold pyridoxal phosphate-dependent enzyme [Alphaproteobacteria bacterium]
MSAKPMLTIHPQARDSIKKLGLQGPLKKHFSQIPFQIDLSNNTNPLSPYLPNYPMIDPLELKQLYLDFIGNESLTPENLLFTVGSADGIDLILRGFAQPPSDVICVTDPTYFAYEHWATLYDLPIKKIPLTGDNFEDISVKNIKNIDPKIFILCNPNNPTGTQVRTETIENICQTINGLVVIDEAYIEFSDQESAAKMLHKYDNLVILRTLSKAWGMAGARCGIILADKRIINTLLYVQAPFSFSIPTQDSVREGLTHSTPLKQSWEIIKQERDKLVQSLKGLSCVSKVYPSQSNFVMVILKDFDKTFARLLNRGIYVASCRWAIPSAIRISVSTKNNNQALLQALDECAIDGPLSCDIPSTPQGIKREGTGTL